ncbi:hypothetical protein EDF39_2431 [Frondihabitans sp. PhB161]|nr:hypothetical protein EDF37_1817 [Frondihabitans sp. PhB153]RPF05722.1 hypothetical protein EDF39_2431 [Frondihabitans sp. PhB161]
MLNTEFTTPKPKDPLRRLTPTPLVALASLPRARLQTHQPPQTASPTNSKPRSTRERGQQ